jgi:S1-C subfamily serine protease
MKKLICCVALLGIVYLYFPADSTAKDSAAPTLKQQARYTVSLALEFRKKDQNSFEKVLAFLNQAGPNGFATGFVVGDGLVMTAYHVVSGDLGDSKKKVLGFSPHDELEVKVFVNGCKATVLKVDREADLALLEVCSSAKHAKPLAFQTSVEKDERIVLIASPHGYKIVTRGVFSGPYTLRGLEYLSAKMEARDGYSGSPVYNQKAEIVGVFSGYDWTQKVALITPGERAQKLLTDYIAEPKTK